MLEYFMFILLLFLTVLFFFFFVFQFQLSHTLTGVLHEKKLRLSHLTVPLPGEANDWFWGP